MAILSLLLFLFITITKSYSFKSILTDYHILKNLEKSFFAHFYFENSFRSFESKPPRILKTIVHALSFGITISSSGLIFYLSLSQNSLLIGTNSTLQGIPAIFL